MLFKDIPGQELVKERLIRNVKDGRISHAQIFYGPEGSGKLALALAYAQYICCTARDENDSCGTCPSCVKYNKYIHPDLHFAYPLNTPQKKDKDTEEESAVNFNDQWREALLGNPYMDQYQWYELLGFENKQGLIGTKESSEIIRKLMLKAWEAEYKVLIMWLPERMNAQAANKLLKLLEEPPPFTLFLLVSENYGDVLPTILSRAQMIKIPKIKDEDIRNGLIRKFNAETDLVEDAVRLADGNFNKAISFVRPNENHKENFERFVALMRSCYGRNISEIMDWVEVVASIGREKQKLFLLYAMRMIRENYFMKLGKKEILHLTGYEGEWSEKFSKFIHNLNIFGLYEEFNNAYNHISANAYARVTFLDMGLTIAKLLRK